MSGLFASRTHYTSVRLPDTPFLEEGLQLEGQRAKLAFLEAWLFHPQGLSVLCCCVGCAGECWVSPALLPELSGVAHIKTTEEGLGLFAEDGSLAPFEALAMADAEDAAGLQARH